VDKSRKCSYHNQGNSLIIHNQVSNFIEFPSKYYFNKYLKIVILYMYNAFVAQSVERVTVNHEVDRSKLSEGVISYKY
jgi:hypothetical protein